MAFASFRDDHEAIGAHRGHESDLCERGYGFDGVTRATANRADFGHTDSRHDFPRCNHLARSVRKIRTTPAETPNCPSGEQLVGPQTGRRRARQQHNRHPADGVAETGGFSRTQRHTMDREFARLRERSSRVIVDSRPSPADDKNNIYTGFDQRGPDGHQVTLDLDAFSDDTPVALD